MRKVSTHPDQSQARRLADYLLTRGIENSVDPGHNAWEVWVHNEDRLDEARSEAETFLADPDHPRYRGAQKESEAIRREAADKERRFRENFIDISTRFRQTRTGWGRVTIVFIIASVIVTLITGFGDDEKPLTGKMYFTDPSQIAPPNQWHLYRNLMQEKGLATLAHAWRGLVSLKRGEIWRLITPIFLHFDFIHILFNMWWLRDLGGRIENRKGILLFLVLVLVSAGVSNTAQYFATGPYGGGFSGVVYALFGYVWMKSRFEPADGLAVHKQTVVILIAWLFLCMTGWLGPIGNTAHAVGLLVGMAFGLAPTALRRFRRGN